MGGSAGGALAAAVSTAGGLGMLGAGDHAWLDRELGPLRALRAPWAAGFLTWAITPGVVERVVEAGARAVMFSFGDPAPHTGVVRDAGALVVLQVTDLDEARRAVDLGADVIVAQGTEAGGHGARRGRSTLTFVPLVIDLAGTTPVLAAGGIADGRGIAAALALGADGVLLGTRFQATPEALADPMITTALLAGRGAETERSTILDVVRGSSWPSRYAARTLPHPHLDRWRGRETELAADPLAQRDYHADVAAGVIPPLPVWAGEAVDLITELTPAADLVEILATQATRALARVR